jgi:small-conductance mechanosensitive channel
MRFLNISVFVAVVSVSTLSAGQVRAQEQRPAQKSQMKSMGKMSMDEMMKDCKERHQAAMKSIDQMTKMMESAKQSNDPAKMRVTLDQSQKQLGEMKEHMSTCSKMMNMMEKMQGTGGMGEMMKDRSK